MVDFNVSIIDQDYTRRARLTHALLAVGRHVEPFESFREFVAIRPDRQVLLVHDEHTQLRDVLRYCEEEGLRIATIAYSHNINPHFVVDAVKSGVFDYYSWPIDPVALNSAIDSCIRSAEARWERNQRTADAKKLVSLLTKREKQVLECLVSGLSNRLIAERFSISTRTIELHRSHIIHKMGASNSADAVRIALEAKGFG